MAVHDMLLDPLQVILVLWLRGVAIPRLDNESKVLERLLGIFTDQGLRASCLSYLYLTKVVTVVKAAHLDCGLAAIAIFILPLKTRRNVEKYFGRVSWDNLCTTTL